MIQDKGSYKISIFGDQYIIKTDESPELISQAASLVDSTMKEIACASKLDAKSIAVLTALRIAHEMLIAGKNQAQHEALLTFINHELMKMGLS